MWTYFIKYSAQALGTGSAPRATRSRIVASEFALAVEAVLSVEPRDVSLLYFLFYVHSAGSVTALVANAGQGGAQDFRVSGGTPGIAIAMADRLGRKRVLLNQPVRRISQGPRSVYVYADKATVRARQVIVAVAPRLAGRIAYEPVLPAVRDQLTQRVPVGSLIKTIAVYDRPFWRDQGFNGQVTSDEGPVQGHIRRLARQRHARVGRIHWAGTETATVWTGYMDGAQSGQRAAAEVVAQL